MAAFLSVVLSNAVGATLLALVAAGVGRFCHRPALAHGLWLLVLLKMITPPLVPIPVHVPGALALTATAQTNETADPAESEEMITALPGGHGSEEVDAPALEAPQEVAIEATSLQALDWRLALLSAWLAGSVCWWGLATFRLCRFRKFLRFAGSAPSEVQLRVGLLASRLGLSSVPDVRFTRGAISPLIWFCGGRSCLLVPEGLWTQLGEAQRDALLVHELAHLRRGDHWVRLLELIVLGLYWWHPVVWWAQRKLREAEEYCCDAWVVWALPDVAATYAATLVETLTFLSRSRSALPLAASGIGAMPIVRRRLTMIMRDTPPRMLSWTGLLALLALGVLLLPFWPTWAQTETPQASHPATEQPPAAEPAVSPKSSRPAFGFVTNAILRNRSGEGDQIRTPQANGAASNEEIESARDEVELAKAQLDIQRAQVAAAEASLKMAMVHRDRVKKLSAQGAISQEDIAQQENAVEGLSLQLNIKRAELRAPEVRLRQAQRRMEHLSRRQAGEAEPYGILNNFAKTLGAHSPAPEEQIQAENLRRKIELERDMHSKLMAEYERRNNPREGQAPRASMRPPGGDAEHLRVLDTKLDAVMAQLEALRLEMQKIQRPRESDSPKR